MNLNGFNQAVGINNFQDSLFVQSGSTIQTGSGTLTLDGDLHYQGNAFNSNPPIPAQIFGNLSTGTGGLRQINIDTYGGNPVPYELQLFANISGSASILKVSNGAAAVLLAGNDSGFSGDFIAQSGGLGIASDTAFGTGTLSLSMTNGFLYDENGVHNIADGTTIDNNFTFAGAEDLNFTGQVSLTGGRTIAVANANTLSLASLGDALVANNAFAKGGIGILQFTGAATFGGTFVVNGQGGTVILGGASALLNPSSVTVNWGGVLQLDNTTAYNANRLRNEAGITLGNYNTTAGNITGGGAALVYYGNAGTAATEVLGAISTAATTNDQVILEAPTAANSSVTLLGTVFNNGAGAVTDFIGEGSALGSANNQLKFLSTAPTVTAGILNNTFLTTILPTAAASFGTKAKRHEPGLRHLRRGHRRGHRRRDRQRQHRRREREAQRRRRRRQRRAVGGQHHQRPAAGGQHRRHRRKRPDDHHRHDHRRA